ncbi:hypothetical protein [Hyphomicrobium sp.]|uniref:hypothetical protein n=1 Tax=Hyphomicrobium sp. TaxID=82 RepID=UPI0025C08745|nr:hypothetical protein [Hyphomicrobium sp.]MCC7251608.1 hypothetical protein [Hyphomicrobium sp.]
MTDLDALVDEMLARNLARAQARNVQQLADAPSALTLAAAKPVKRRREPKPPVSEPQHEVSTSLTRSEHMALERLAREYGITTGEMLRWCLQAYCEEAECRRGD